MLVSFTQSHQIDAKVFRVLFPFCPIKVIDVDEHSFLAEPINGSASHMEIVTWYVDDYCKEIPQSIDFDYATFHESLTVVYPNGSVTFTFFNYE